MLNSQGVYISHFSSINSADPALATVQNHTINKSTQRLDFKETETKKGKFISEGAFGKVYHFDFQGPSSTIDAVVKCCNYDTREKKMDLTFEINCLEQFRHPNIIKILAYAHKENPHNETQGEFLIIMEDGGKSLQKRVDDKEIDNAHVCLSIMNHILKGVEYMHTVFNGKFVHRDLKPDNIFIRRNIDVDDKTNKDYYIVKIGDLGLMTNFDDNKMNNRTVKGTSMFMPPELFNKRSDGEAPGELIPEDFYTQSIDIYATALIFMFIVSGIVPFFVQGINQSLGKIPYLPDYFPKKMTECLVKMLCSNPNERLKSEDCKYIFYHGIDNKRARKAFSRAWSKYRSELKDKSILDYDYDKTTNLESRFVESSSSSDGDDNGNMDDDGSDPITDPYKKFTMKIMKREDEDFDLYAILGYLIEIRQVRPKNCPNFQNFSENRKCAIIYFEKFSKNRKKPSKNVRLRRKIAKCAFLLPKNAPFMEKGFPKVIKSGTHCLNFLNCPIR